MKKPIVWTIILFFLILIAFYTPVTADQDNSDVGNVTNTGSTLKELPELDMTGMDTDIELIEIDPEVVNSTSDWMVLAHDDAGKKLLIDDIDTSELSAAEKIDMKKAVKKLWDTYPTKFEDAGQKSIGIVVQSDGSNRTLSVPIGHVTRITFDKEKIRQVAKDNNDVRLMQPEDVSGIVLSDTENRTMKNITNIRAKKIKENSIKHTNPSSTGSVQVSSNPGNSFASSNPASSSSFTSESGFSSSTNVGGTTGTGLLAWYGSHSSPDDPIPDNKNSYTGHNRLCLLGSTIFRSATIQF